MSQISNPLLRNAHEYGETIPQRDARLRSNAEDPRPGIDLTDDRRDDYEPVPWWAIDPSFKTLRPPGALSHARVAQDTAASPPGWNPQDAAGNDSVADGLGGPRSSATHPTSKKAA
jgi:hypothetical protein